MSMDENARPLDTGLMEERASMREILEILGQRFPFVYPAGGSYLTLPLGSQNMEV